MAGEYDAILDEEEAAAAPESREAERYDDVLAAEAEEHQKRLGASLRQSLGVKPDTAAQHQALSKATGVPQEVVERNEGLVAQQVRVKQLLDLARTSPILAQQLADPEFAKLAHDDAEQLGAIEQAFAQVKRAGRFAHSAVHRAGSKVWGMGEWGADVVSKYITGPLAGTILPQDPMAIAAAKFRASRKEAADDAKRILRDDQNLSLTEAGVFGGVASFTENALLLPFAILSRNPNVALLPMSGMTASEGIAQGKDAGLSLLERTQFGASQGVIEYATEKLPVSKLIGDLKQGLPFWQLVMRQAALEIPGEQLATVLQDLNEWAVLKPDAPFSAYLAERPSAAAQTLISTMVSVGGQTTLAKGVEMAANKLGAELERADEAKQYQQYWKQLHQLAGSSLLRERAPDTFGEFIQNAAEDGPVTDVYVSGRELAQILEQAPNVPIPDSVREQLPEALATGGDVKIPIGEYTAHLAASDAGKALLEHLKTTPEAMSFAESQVFYQEQAAAFKQQAEQILTEQTVGTELRAQADAVHAHFVAQLEQAQRFTPDVNTAYAALMRDFYVTTAQRLGITPVEMLQRYPLRIAAENVAAEQVMDQTVSLDTPEFKNWFGSSEVVDAQGKPRVMYHGTGGDIKAFDPSRTFKELQVTFLSPSPDFASGFAGGEQPNVMPVHVRAEKTFDYQRPADLEKFTTWAVNVLGLPFQDAVNLTIDVATGNWEVLEQDSRVADFLMTGGFDAFWVNELGHKNLAVFKPEQIKSTFNARPTDSPNVLEQSSLEHLKEIAGLSRIEKHLKPEEKKKLRKDTAKRLLELLRDLPTAKEMAAVALAGEAKRGWYQHSAEAMVSVFGPDAPRFAALLAAMSPQTSVESNLYNALNTWKNWIAAGRPQGREEIKAIMGKSVEGRKGEDSVLYAWVPNTVRALTAEDPTKIVLSGPKVNSFFLNLVGVTDEVTNDSWMANYAAVDQVIFSGRLNVAGTDPGKTPGYLAMSVRTRQAAETLTKLTGEAWTPSEVQETVWSWVKTIFEQAESALNKGKTAVELLKSGAITDELINATPDFRTLFLDPKYQEIFEKAGYGDQIRQLESAQRDNEGAGEEKSRAGGEAGAPAGDPPNKHRLAAARRLDTLRRERRESSLDARGAPRAGAGARGLRDAGGVRGGAGPLAGEPGQDPLLNPVEGLPQDIEVPGRGTVRFGPFKTARLAALLYMERQGMRYVPATKYGKIDPKRGERIAKAFAEMKHAPNDPEVREAYAAMITETIEQWREIEKTGLKVEFITGDDPYALSPRYASLDVIENNHLWVFPTEAGFGGGAEAHVDTSGNPLEEWTDIHVDGRRLRANDVFRIVHDYFGHVKEGFGFRAEGEDNAWQSHSAMYSPLARRAMTTETRGQNSWVNFGPYAKQNKGASTAKTQYAPQKIGLLPEWVSEEGRLAGAESGMGVFEQRDPLDKALAGLEAMTVDSNARGQIAFGTDITGGATISLLKNADLSTVLHELGHFFLEVQAHIAGRPDAPPAIAQDMATTLRWLGIKPTDKQTATEVWLGMTLAEKREYHEKFARGFEAYLFEGKSPSVEMRTLFARFRAWLINVYKTVSALNVEITDEVRGVFDRMLASEEAIASAEGLRAMAPMFTSPTEAAATTAEWQNYQELGAVARDDAVRQLERRSLADMKWASNARAKRIKELQAEADEKRAAIREEVIAEVQLEPIYQAIRFLSKGELLEGDRTNAQRRVLETAGLEGSKLSLADLKEMYGGEANALWRYFPTGKTGMVTAEGGLHPDQAAELLGFSSGDELVRKLLAAEPMYSVVDGMTDQRMLERHGDLVDEAAIKRAADEAVANDARARFVATELRFLDRVARAGKPTPQGGSANILAKAAKQFAETILSRKRIKEIRPAQYTAAEARAARAALKAKNPQEKAVEKRNQLVNLYASRAAHAAVSEVEKAVRYLRRFEGNVESVDTEYLDQIHQLLERFDLRVSVSQTDIKRRVALAEWVEEQRELGFEPTIDKALLAEAQRQHYSTLTLEEFRGLVDAAKNIEHLGRLKQKLLTAKDEREFKERVTEAVASIKENATGTVKERKSSDRGPLVALGRMFRGFTAEHRKFSSLMREMDGIKDGGVMWELFSRTMNEAGDKEASMREAATMKLAELFKPIFDGPKLGKKTFVAQVNASFTREERLGIALNMGNEINRERVLTGQRWSPAQLEAVLDTLTKEEWDFVQRVWDYLQSFQPEMAAKSKRVTGVEPEWVEPRQVVTKHGMYRGGYYPIKYDPLLDSRSEADDAAAVQRQMERGLYVRAQTRRGHLEARAESTGRRLNFSLGAVFQHVDQVIHDLSWHEWLIDANRLLRAKALDGAIREHYGPEKLAQLKNALRDIAVGDIPAANSWEKFLNHVRTGATIVGLGWNVATSLMQPLGLTQSIVRVGPVHVLRGLGRWITDPEAGTAWIYERSEFMRLRGKTLQREINEIRNKVAGRISAIEASYFYLINAMQKIADIPTWLGAYEKAMRQNDMTEERAVALADQAVIDSQGSGQIKDLAAIQKGGPALKLWTNFYSFFNTSYNLAIERTKATKKLSQVPALAVDYVLLMIVPSVLGTLIRETLKWDADDEEELAKRLAREQLNYLFGLMVGLREMGAAVQGFQGYAGPGGTRFFSEAAKLVKQTGQGEVDEAALKALANATGVLTHLPTGQVVRTIDGIHALVTGQTENPGALIVGSKDN